MSSRPTSSSYARRRSPQREPRNDGQERDPGAERAAATSSNYPQPFAQRVAGRQKRALGDQFGIAAYGVNLVTLAPGAQSSLRHRHTVQEEFVLILKGELVLVDDHGETLCVPGMCAGFVLGAPPTIS